MTSVVVSDGGGNIVEYVTVVEEPHQVSLDSFLIKSKPVDKKQRSLCCLFVEMPFTTVLPCVFRVNISETHDERISPTII